MRTEGLLTQSQQLTVELQSRQSELQQTNEELGTKARLLAEQNAEVERKNAEVEQARRALEEKAAELALTSKYKSEFLANMSHELRTPLNSILILSQQLAENARRQPVDASRSSSRATSTRPAPTCCTSSTTSSTSRRSSRARSRSRSRRSRSPALRDDHRPQLPPRRRGEEPAVPRRSSPPDLPRSMDSDPKRLQQILKNLLSNAVKFTAHGHVDVRVELATQGWSAGPPGAEQGAAGRRLRGRGHRHRRRAGEAEAHLRGLPAGRRRHLAQVRRHRPGPGHQPRAGRAARRRDQARQRARPGQHLHALPAAALRRRRAACAPARRGRRRHPPSRRARA